ncbi:MAG TPA: lipoyl domain-containing protein [Armatimonadota bacterium]|nr:lipoyl domain-containing protein [Armatimonadota bacterium]HOS43298.1 lipoyl domain-containing protein [Armatimonadota bacterium]
MATTDVIMPQLGFDMEEGTIQRWLKQEGDHVERGDALAEVETEKVTLQVESYATGTLTKITRGEGETVPVGEKIGEIDEA